jgi:hypothetical protein
MIVIDDFIKDKNLLLEIEQDNNFNPESLGAGPYTGKFMFWDGWWKSPADSVRKKVIKEIWQNNLPLPEEEIAGFEYWNRRYNVGESIGHHFDEDGFLYRDKKIFRGTVLGCVYYPHINQEFEGGFLEIHKFHLEDETEDNLEWENINLNISPIEERERIACKPNRLIIFDGGHYLHNTSPIISGFKLIFGVNVWHRDFPPHAINTGDFYYE